MQNGPSTQRCAKALGTLALWECDKASHLPPRKILTSQRFCQKPQGIQGFHVSHPQTVPSCLKILRFFFSFFCLESYRFSRASSWQTSLESKHFFSFFCKIRSKIQNVLVCGLVCLCLIQQAGEFSEKYRNPVLGVNAGLCFWFQQTTLGDPGKVT